VLSLQPKNGASMIFCRINRVMRFQSGSFVPFLTVLLVAAAWLQPGPARSAPKVTVISPSFNQIITEQQAFLLSGQVEDSHGLKSVSIFLNDIALEKRTTRGIKVVDDESLTFIRDLKGLDVWPFKIRIPSRLLQEGENVLELVVKNLSGEKTTFQQPLYYKPTQAGFFVVAIGINQYQDPNIPALRYAENDARAVANYFVKKVGIPQSDVKVLLGRDATLMNIKKVLGVEFKKRAQKKDQIVIYFAGHGAPEPEPNSQNSDGLEKYLLPYDANLDSLYATAFPMRELDYLINRYSSERVVLLMDTCFSGQAGSNGRTINFKGMGLRAGMLTSDFFNRMSKGKGKMILTASAANQVSHEFAEFGHGAFTYYLLEGLEGKADYDKDGIVTVNEAHQYVSKMVPQKTQQNQVPQLFGGGSEVVLGRAASYRVHMNITQADLEGGRVIIEVMPPEAEIFIDGNSRGNGPVLNTTLKVGTHQILVRRKNYTAQKKNISVAKNSLSRMTIKLEGTMFVAPPP